MVVTKERQDKINEKVEWCRRHAIAAGIEPSEDFDKANAPVERTRHAHNGLTCDTIMFVSYRP